ncbi:surface protein [Vibrio metschnikovii]|uniref:Lcl C-terminal domain-containing protein n=1 Tax=Vibrio metschnikovii TaxID=28172 RepID=UPI0001B93F1F|nr:DUF1566 domain-containing protein [Vibrio metschnikovii]EEX36176.1 ig domain protein group 2 domain protein [Vibrio metschnikovii CIP 69.14]MBC3617047.1 DUF1566 domain-containing protein [Vibrio metschnikovii]MBC5813218.1 DUF1566 domain-containing protein [Vibrio metschnikovii]SUP50256.1 surface protein [Vibrio metschnikovii]SUQ09833.1 surface protein [Vibrio metschnikovii]
MNDIKIISILLSGLLLAGCNGSDDKDIIERPQSSPSASNINASLHNITRTVLIDKPTTIALAKRNNERISDIELIAEVNEFDCYNFNINDSELVINPDTVGNCIYQYQTESFDGSFGSQGILHLAKSASLSAINTTGSLNSLNFDAPRLPIYSYAVQIQDNPLYIDINQLHSDKVNQGFSISTAALSGPSGAMFEFFESGFRFATDQTTQLGAYRIYYGLTNGMETYLGQIDIAVGNKTNMGFSVQSYRYNTSLEVDQTVTISLSQLSSVVDNPEGDTLEIVQVSTINASASTDGTSLTFSAPSRGDYSLSYLLTDNLGAFVMGQVMFYVKGPFEDIKTPLGTLMAPITLEDALEIGFDYSSPNVDTQKSAEIATFTYDVAEAICTLYGAKLPSKSIIDSIYKLSAINDIKTLWPIDKPYILQGIQTDEQGTQVYTGQSFKTDILNTLYVGDNEIIPETSYLSCYKNKDKVCDDLTGPCIDIFNTGSGKLFTNSPSVAFFNSIGGSQDVDAIINNDIGGNFYTFTWYRARDLCVSYNTNIIGGRTNWRLPTVDELKSELFNVFGNMTSARGWPVSTPYWTTLSVADNYYHVNLADGYSGDMSPINSFYTSCVSEP